MHSTRQTEQTEQYKKSGIKAK